MSPIFILVLCAYTFCSASEDRAWNLRLGPDVEKKTVKPRRLPVFMKIIAEVEGEATDGAKEDSEALSAGLPPLNLRELGLGDLAWLIEILNLEAPDTEPGTEKRSHSTGLDEGEKKEVRAALRRLPDGARRSLQNAADAERTKQRQLQRGEKRKEKAEEKRAAAAAAAEEQAHIAATAPALRATCVRVIDKAQQREVCIRALARARADLRPSCTPTESDLLRQQLKVALNKKAPARHKLPRNLHASGGTEDRTTAVMKLVAPLLMGGMGTLHPGGILTFETPDSDPLVKAASEMLLIKGFRNDDDILAALMANYEEYITPTSGGK